MNRTPWKVAVSAIALAVAMLTLAACGSREGGTTTQPPPLSASTANHLAKLSDRVATDLDAGDTCAAAYAADDLNAAVEDAGLPARLQPEVTEIASTLVDEVNCPPPPPPPEPEKKEKKPKDEADENGDDQGNEGSGPPGHSKHGGFVPPGQAKLKGGKFE